MPRTVPHALLAIASLACLAAPANAQEVWSSDPFQALVTLPAPQPGSPVISASMSCAEQVWTLSLSFPMSVRVAGATGTAFIAVPRETFEAPSKAVAGGVEIIVPNRALEPIKAATRLSISFAGAAGEIRFPLTGSRRAITAAEALCSRRTVPLANSVPLTPYSSYLLLARELRQADISEFELSTMSQPSLRAGMVEIGEGRRLLFAELCGSTWYYGVSGCNLAGYAPVAGKDPATPEGWHAVYETEGVFLYTDPDAASEGWPDLIAYPMKADSERTRWIWNGDRYEPADLALSAGGPGGTGEQGAGQ
jgi:hypothetical protein